MNTESNPNQLELHALGRRSVISRFDDGKITSDGGCLLLREVNARIGLMERLADCFDGYRHMDLIEHPVRALAWSGA